MGRILYIEFAKSRSAKFKSIITMCKQIPNYSENNGRYIIGIDTIKDFLYNQNELFQIIEQVKHWNDSIVLFYDKEYKSKGDLKVFVDNLKSEAGIYATLLECLGEVSLGAVTIEQLRLPFVFYPNLYGCFFAFAEDINSEKYFCECERKAISNFLKLLENNKNEYERRIKQAFPPSCIKDVINHTILFKEKICFRCNKIIPRKKYCLPMYGGSFKQHYGWYIEQEYYRLGVDRYILNNANVQLEEGNPELIDILLRINEQLSTEEYSKDNSDQIYSLHKQLYNAMENSVREQLGFKKIGDAWVSETILYNIVQELYPSYEILRHHRPVWLEGLELDVYIPDLKLGFEYQGIQHFKAVKHWGGEKQLEKQKEHDERKLRLCGEHGVSLICINYDEPLNKEYIQSKIND